MQVAHRHERYFFCLVIIILTAVDLDTLETVHFFGQFMVWALALILLIGLAKFWEIKMVAGPLNQLWNIVIVRFAPKSDEDQKTED